MSALICLQRQFAKLASKLFYCWSLLHNNNLATNLQMLSSFYGNLANWCIVYTVHTKFENFGIFSKLLVFKFLIWYI